MELSTVHNLKEFFDLNNKLLTDDDYAAEVLADYFENNSYITGLQTDLVDDLMYNADDILNEYDFNNPENENTLIAEVQPILEEYSIEYRHIPDEADTWFKRQYLYKRIYFYDDFEDIVKNSEKDLLYKACDNYCTHFLTRFVDRESKDEDNPTFEISEDLLKVATTLENDFNELGWEWASILDLEFKSQDEAIDGLTEELNEEYAEYFDEAITSWMLDREEVLEEMER